MSQVTEQFARAQLSLAGGVASSTRVNKALGHPLYIARGKGCEVWDLDGKRYLDLCCSHGATLLGHGDERVMAAVQEALAAGACCSYENEKHAELAELLCQTIPCFERVRFTGSGTEAVMHTLRLARAYTGRTKILKIEGHFHGYHDQMMYSIGTPADRLGTPESPTAWPGSAGMPPALADQLVLVPYNRTDLLTAAIEKHGHELAAVILEPIYYNAGCVLPEREFLEAVTTLPRKHGMLLIFDEVLCAFRMGPGGAQEYLGVTPDLCTVGKAVGGGFPLSVFGGKREIMERLMPQGDCQHSGTYNGHPTVVAAGLAAIKAYREPTFYEHINAVGERLFGGLNAIFQKHEVRAHVQGLGARFGVYFGIGRQVRSYRDAVQHQREQMLRFIKGSIEHGVYFHDYGGAACHHGFCHAMTLAHVDDALERLDETVKAMANR